MFWISAIFFWLIMIIATGALAASKGRWVFGWVFNAIVFAPVTALILLALPNLRTEREAARRHQEVVQALAHREAPPTDTRDCPHCAERIKVAAKVCKHCGRDVEPVVAALPVPERVVTPNKCPACEAFQKPGAQQCPACGTDFRTTAADSTLARA